MRTAQNAYYKSRDNRDLRRARAIEDYVDKEIRRVKEILIQRGDY